MIRELGREDLVASEPSRRRDRVIAMIAERLLFPSSKLAHTRHWLDTTLAEELGVGDATEDQLDDAMDWLRARQEAIEKERAKRHLGDGALVLDDVTSSSSEGKTCPLARFGHDRDGKTGCPLIVSGALTDADGRPVAVQVYPGNTGDPTTVPDQVEARRSGSACRGGCWSAIAACSRELRLMCSRSTRAWAGSRPCAAVRSAACWPTAT